MSSAYRELSLRDPTPKESAAEIDTFERQQLVSNQCWKPGGRITLKAVHISHAETRREAWTNVRGDRSDCIVESSEEVMAVRIVGCVQGNEIRRKRDLERRSRIRNRQIVEVGPVWAPLSVNTTCC